MKLTTNILAQDIFLYLPQYNTLIISDIHAGFEESLQKNGVLLPKSAVSEIMLRIEKAINKIGLEKIKCIILNGDIVHSFSKHSLDEKYALKKILDFLKKFGKIIIIKGNHDKILEMLVKNVEFRKNLILGEILITHGDIIDENSKDKKIKIMIIGHEHPSIVLDSGLRQEKYKCFLKGKYKNKELIVMPSSNTLIEGSDVLKEKLLSPYIKSIDSFQVYAIADEIYDFGKISQLRKKLG
jgi:hypothetical protein